MGNKIKLTESQLKKVIIETYKKVVLEDGRADAYKTQIEKDFPGALNNYDGKTPYDQYYLQLSNDKKEQDKLNKRELSKQATRDRNEKYKAEFGERDKELKRQNAINRNKEIISDFVGFLPENLPRVIEDGVNKTNQGVDSIFYFLLGQYISEFSRYYFSEDEKRGADFLQKLINDKYEDYFFGEIDVKYGPHVIEW
jgi:hypothetical protein